MIIVNLGSRNNLMRDAINMDLMPIAFTPKDSIYEQMNIEEIDTRFEFNSVDAIFANHIFEHLTHFQITTLLYKLWGVLKKGGELSITVPDFHGLINHYAKKHEDGDFSDVDILHLKIFDVEEETMHRSVWYESIGRFYLERESFFKVVSVSRNDGSDAICPSNIEITFKAIKV